MKDHKCNYFAGVISQRHPNCFCFCFFFGNTYGCLFQGRLVIIGNYETYDFGSLNSVRDYRCGLNFMRKTVKKRYDQH